MAYESTRAGVATPGAPSPREAVTQAADTSGSAMGRSSASRSERARSRAAAGLEGAAKSVHAGVERAAGAGHSAADALSDSAQYVREHDMSGMMEDLMDVVRDNPRVALLGAAAVGFLVGHLLTRD
jgi:ElaB/YqjD/DUF883 family membrane-anchored ribosome-binding protein